MIASLERRIGLAGIVCTLLAVTAPRAHADELWVAPTYQLDLGGLGVASNLFWPVSPAGVTRLAWSTPANLQTLQSARVAVIPGAAAGGPAALHFFICAAANGDAIAAGSCTG